MTEEKQTADFPTQSPPQEISPESAKTELPAFDKNHRRLVIAGLVLVIISLVAYLFKNAAFLQ